jgi:predicted metal-dependent hydrolase
VSLATLLDAVGRRKVREERFDLDCGSRTLPLAVRRHPAARRLTLRVDPGTGQVVVTVPYRVPVREGVALAERKLGWILARLERVPERIAFADGVLLPVGGVPHTVQHRPEARRGVWLEGATVCVSGRPEHLARRLVDWLRGEARHRLIAVAAEKAALLGRGHGRLTVRDTRSRWGSCSAKGDLSFCWRLVLAPDFVLDYVVAHEVAHLAEHNHGPRFWKTVATLTPHRDAARAWLKRHGDELRRYG